MVKVEHLTAFHTIIGILQEPQSHLNDNNLSKTSVLHQSSLQRPHDLVVVTWTIFWALVSFSTNSVMAAQTARNENKKVEFKSF